MDQYKRHRKVLRTAFSKIGNELEQLLTAEGTDLQEIQVNWDLLQEKHESLQDINKNVFEALLSANVPEEELEVEMDSCDGYTKRFKTLKYKFEQIRGTAESIDEERASTVSRPTSNMSSTTGKRKFKLPIIEFKKFTGDIRDWLSFWGQFKKINDDPDIDTADKFQYLIQATVPNSRARELVESFPPNSENYKNVIESLKSRFGREDLQIEVYIRELLKLILNNAMSTNKMGLSTLYDKIETQLRSLETLGVTNENCAAMLFPLIESCLPEDLLRVWQRSTSFSIINSDSGSSAESQSTTKNRLKKLMCFLKSEVENEERISLAAEGFGLCTRENRSKQIKPKKFGANREEESSIPSATGLMNCDVTKCIFCAGTHNSQSCFKAQKYTLEQKKNALTEKKACYRCLRTGHPSRKCRERLRCLICKRSHVALMCPDLQSNKANSTHEPVVKEEKTEKEAAPLGHVLANYSGTHVFLQTLRVKIVNGEKSRNIRLVIDTGSQRSYILKATADELGYKSKRMEKIIHSLFGGTNTSEQTHHCYDVKLVNKDYLCTLEVLDQHMICNGISPIIDGPWMDELRSLNVHISDIHNSDSIELLIGADVVGKLYTGRKYNLRCGLVAVETLLGWTLMGKIPPRRHNTEVVTSMLSFSVNDFSLKNLWELDILGIDDPVERKSREEITKAAKDLFLQTISTNDEGRYEVRLPWLEGHPPLSDNLSLARKRLDVTLKKLSNEQLFESYDGVFKEWLHEGIIEEIKYPSNDTNRIHYLPHRPVIKENSATTKIRPVFDASAHERDKPSLNHCVEKGPNLVESIPSILIRFRKEKFAVVSDIRKAFLQISLHEADRDYLRFLWVDDNGKEIVYRHRRVVFGVNCSPFLLGATIEYHLSTILDNCSISDHRYSKKTIERLTTSFYVDNCMTSLPDQDSLQQFIREASIIMAEGKFDLRGWEFTQTEGEHSKVPVLGLIWNPLQDTLGVNDFNGTDLKDTVITKRVILSMSHRVFDPIGFTSPATLYPKLLLQSLWKTHLRWDDPVDDEIKNSFISWVKELHYLEKIQISKWIGFSAKNIERYSLHTFVDASKDAYSAVVYLRVESDQVSVHLLGSKSRVKPLKNISIPRMELLAANIGARLYDSMKQNFEMELKSYFWSDSSTVISWIQRSEPWATFVGNRVQEIRRLTDTESWRHIAGTSNPADLPSRGCSPRQLYQSKWWEGPTWLYNPTTSWLTEEMIFNENEIIKERKKSFVTTMLNYTSDDWHLGYFSKYYKIIRMVAWIFRFIHNLKNPSSMKKDPLSVQEIDEAEKFIVRLIQQECFDNEEDCRLNSLCPFKDEFGLIRLKSRISRREDVNNFRFPIVLPSKHYVVNRLIFDTHVRMCHIGTEGLLSNLRERYWILGGRRAIRSVIKKCVICRRYNAKNFQNPSPPLPSDRVRDAVAFEITGVDLAGPLHMKSGEKSWICLFTCAVYRAIHLELTTSLSTHGFIQALRRFVARRGRPRTIYSDNGTNFVGAENAFSRLNWSDISDYASTQRISWKFNRPTASWWGGFWERLVGILKQLLTRVLGRSSLFYEDLMTVLCDCEATVNSRPLTYLADNPNDLIALSPAMFLRDLTEHGMPDCDSVEKSSLNRKMAYKQKLRDDLRHRFRNEYLGQLKLMTNQKQQRQVTLGEIVLVGNDHTKRLDWPLGRITQLIPGKDNKIRLVQVVTAKGTLLRPIQRIYPLECIDAFTVKPDLQQSKQEDVNNPETIIPEDEDVSEGLRDEKCDISRPTITRSGRVCKPPKRYS